MSAKRNFYRHQAEAAFFLSSNPAACTATGKSILRSGMFIAFQAGKSVTHQLVNRTVADVFCREISA
jgi:uncharacterized cupin superfamily protein